MGDLAVDCAKNPSSATKDRWEEESEEEGVVEFGIIDESEL